MTLSDRRRPKRAVPLGGPGLAVSWPVRGLTFGVEPIWAMAAICSTWSSRQF
jgi:hypothetical protein